jgi:hypothetical protein
MSLAATVEFSVTLGLLFFAGWLLLGITKNPSNRSRS